MAGKYWACAEVDEDIRVLRLTWKPSQTGLEGLCREMVERLFHARKVSDLWIKPWHPKQGGADVTQRMV